MDIGEDNLGEFARKQLENTRRDPRLERGRGAMIADFWAALEEAEHARTFSITGLYELRNAYERERARKASRAGSDTPSSERTRDLQALWERSAMAKALIDGDNAALNAQTLVSMNSALDALVEEFVPSMQDMLVQWAADEALKRAEKEVPEATEHMTEELREQFRRVLPKVVDVPAIGPLRGSGIQRYEALLDQVHLAAPTDRPIPPDLDEALTELGAIRDVLVHRAGRVDQRALDQAPTLPYKTGELIRISGDDYRKYSAAVRCYGSEIIYRPLRHWPASDDQKHGPNLVEWRKYYVIGA